MFKAAMLKHWRASQLFPEGEVLQIIKWKHRETREKVCMTGMYLLHVEEQLMKEGDTCRHVSTLCRIKADAVHDPGQR